MTGRTPSSRFDSAQALVSATCRAKQSLASLQAGQSIPGLPARRDEAPLALHLSPARPSAARMRSFGPCGPTPRRLRAQTRKTRRVFRVSGHLEKFAEFFEYATKVGEICRLGVARGRGAGGRAFSRGEADEDPREPRIVHGPGDGAQQPCGERRKGRMFRGGLRLVRKFRFEHDHPDIAQSRQLGADRVANFGNPEPADRGPRRRIRGQGERFPGQTSGPHVRHGFLAEDPVNRAFYPHQQASLLGERAGWPRPPENRTDSPGLWGLISRRRFPHGEEVVSQASNRSGGG